MNQTDIKHNELISIIIPIYNAEKFLRLCLDSVVNQTYKETEIILVDDGSTDRSGEICDEYAKKDSRITVLHQKNQGVSAARNHALIRAKGDWIVFVDADDWIDSNYLKDCLPFLAKTIDIIFVNEYRSCQKNNPAIQHLRKKDLELFERCLLNKTLLREQPRLSTPWAKIYRKSIIDRHNLYFDIKLQKGEDALFNQEYLYYSQCGIWLKQGYYHYVQHKGSITHSYSPSRMQNYQVFTDELRMFFESVGTFETYAKDFQYRILYNLFNCFADDCCHPRNGMSYKERKERFYTILATDEYYKNLEWNVIHLRRADAILGWFIKHRLFLPVNILLSLYNRV